MASFDESRSVKCSSEESYQMGCSPCENDGIVKEAKYFCTECQEYLCQSCETLHKRFKGTRNHNISLCADNKTEPREVDGSTVMCSCKRNDTEIYCEYHNEVFCSDCKTIKHRQCKTKSMDDVIAELDTDFDTEAIKHADEVKCSVEKIITEWKQSLEQLNADTDHRKEDIISFANELKNKIDTLKENAVADLYRYSCLHTEVTEHHVSACETALKTLSFECSNHQKVKESKNKRQRFVTNLKLKQTLKDLDILTEDIKKEVYEPSLSFERNQDLSDVLDIESLGSVTHNLCSMPRNFNADMTILSSRRVNIKLSSDETVPWISNSVFLPSGDIILCDRNNNVNSVKHFSSEFVFMKSIKLPGKPGGCSLINENEFLVSLSDRKQIQRYQTLPFIELKGTINLDQQCEDIDTLGQDIFVICHNKPNKEIRTIDQEGSLKRKIVINEHDKDVFLCSFYITVSDLGDIYVSESCYNGKTGQIRCFRNNGKYRYTVSNKDLGGTGGMLLDDEGRLVACFCLSNSVKLISKDGSRCDDFFKSDADKLDSPYSISFRKSDVTLILTYRDNSDMLVYKLKQIHYSTYEII